MTINPSSATRTREMPETVRAGSKRSMPSKRKGYWPRKPMVA